MVVFISLPTFKFCNMGDSIFNASRQFGPVDLCEFQHLCTGLEDRALLEI